MVLLNENIDNAYPWYRAKNIFVRGYVYHNNTLLTKQELADYFNVPTISDFQERLKDSNGAFSVIILQDIDIWLAVDNIRSFPIFFAKNREEWIVSDSAELIKEKINASLDEKSITEFLGMGYVLDDRTLFSDIYQIRASSYVHLSLLTYSANEYNWYITELYLNQTYDHLFQNAIKVFTETFQRSFLTIGSSTPVLALSAGYDSRLIACMLKKFGFQNTICYSYGRKNNYESYVSKKIADKLHFKWIFVEYNDKTIEGYLQHEIFQSYYKYSANASSMFFMQEFFAIKELKEKSLIPKDSVFLSGHCGDFLGGSQLRKYHVESNSSIDVLKQKIFDDKFNMDSSKRFKKEIINSIHQSLIRSYSNFPNSYSYSVYEDWDMKEKLSKLITNSLNVYHFFGYRNVIPFWDKELVTFFSRLPYYYKVNTCLYQEVLIQHFFSPYGLDIYLKREEVKRNWILDRVKKMIRNILPYWIVERRLLLFDNIFYKEITMPMLNEMKQHKYKYQPALYLFNSYLVQWYVYKTRES